MQITRELLGKAQKYRGSAFGWTGNHGTLEGENLLPAFLLLVCRVSINKIRDKFEAILAGRLHLMFEPHR